MFDKQYTFRGTHARKVRELVSEFNEQKDKLFDFGWNVYVIAPIVGFLFGNKSDSNSEGGQPFDIFPQQVLNARDELMFAYRLIMLLDNEHEVDFNKRTDKAFRDYGKKESALDYERFNTYVLGGVDTLYDNIIAGAQGIDNYIRNLYVFMDEVENKLSSKAFEITDLCQLAKD